MDFKELKKLIGENGRCVIIENDKPAYVVMTAKEFLALHAMPDGRQEKQADKPLVLPVREEKQILPEPLAEKENVVSFINAEDNSAVELQDIMFENLGIDELPE